MHKALESITFHDLLPCLALTEVSLTAACCACSFGPFCCVAPWLMKLDTLDVKIRLTELHSVVA